MFRDTTIEMIHLEAEEKRIERALIDKLYPLPEPATLILMDPVTSVFEETATSEEPQLVKGGTKRGNCDNCYASGISIFHNYRRPDGPSGMN